MKEHSLKTWITFISTGALLICGGTVAISWDLIQTRNKELSESSGKIIDLQRELRIVRAQHEDLKTKSQNLANTTEDLVSSFRVVNERQEKLAELQGKLKKMEVDSARAEGIRMAIPSYPAWNPPAPTVAKNAIRDRALSQHRDDLSAANYEIERQTEAFEKIVGWHNKANSALNAIIAKAAFERGTDYSGLAYEVERQIEAADKLNRR